MAACRMILKRTSVTHFCFYSVIEALLEFMRLEEEKIVKVC